MKPIKQSHVDGVRRQFITHLIEKWTSENQILFNTWKTQNKTRIDNLKKITGAMPTDDFVERIVWSMPAELFNYLDTFIENPRICETKDEEKWFVTNFPAFKAVEKY